MYFFFQLVGMALSIALFCLIKWSSLEEKNDVRWRRRIRHRRGFLSHPRWRKEADLHQRDTIPNENLSSRKEIFPSSGFDISPPNTPFYATPFLMQYLNPTKPSNRTNWRSAQCHKYALPCKVIPLHLTAALLIEGLEANWKQSYCILSWSTTLICMSLM